MRRAKSYFSIILAIVLLIGLFPIARDLTVNAAEAAVAAPGGFVQEERKPLSEEDAYVLEAASVVTEPAGLQMDAKGMDTVRAIVWLSELPTSLRPRYEALGMEDPAYEQAARDAVGARAAINSYAESIEDFYILAEYSYVFAGFGVLVPAYRLAELADLPGVYAVTADKLHTLSYNADPTYAKRGNRGARELFGIGALHAQGIDGRGVNVAVLDSGLYTNHPDFAGVYKGGWNYSYGAQGGNYTGGNSNMASPDGNHGTHCAGTIASQGAGGNTSSLGMAPGCNLYIGQVFPNAYDSVIIAAFEDVSQTGESGGHLPKVDVVSCSFGYNDETVNSGTAYSAEAYTINNMTLNGISVVIAAGNEADIRGSYRDLYTLGVPASSASFAIAVAAGEPGGDATAAGSQGIRNEPAYFSSCGPVVETSYIKPDIMAPGWYIWSTNSSTGYGQMSGTSMATPCVSGLVALLKQVYPNATPAELKARLMNTADISKVSASTRRTNASSWTPYFNSSATQVSVWEQGAAMPISRRPSLSRTILRSPTSYPRARKIRPPYTAPWPASASATSRSVQTPGRSRA
ncbi:MAG: S8 family serine peptidase [Clostridiales bacterium]|nr:S8 family serine peptidase [Clostridiales bacterium]